jgi:hypothetical protein
MKHIPIITAMLLCAGIAGSSTALAVSAERTACSLLSLAEVQAVVGPPVTIMLQQNTAGTAPTGGALRTTSCTYKSSDHLFASVMLVQGPSGDLATYKKRLDLRGGELVTGAIRGAAFVSVRVQTTRSASGFDRAASTRLLSAVERKLS